MSADDWSVANGTSRRQRRVRRRAAQVGVELDIGQVVDVDVDRRQDQRLAGVGGERRVAELGDADVELDVGRVDVPQVLERHAVGAGVAGQDEPRAADADGHVGLDGLLDLEAVGRDGHLAVGVGDLDVVQAVGARRQVELGEDLGAVDEVGE